MPRRPPTESRLVDPKTGIIEPAWLDYFKDGASTSETDIGSLLSGVAQAQATAEAAQAAADGAQQAAQDVGANSLTFYITLDQTSLFQLDNPGSVVTDAVTVTPTGGTAPYTYAWTQVSGDPINIVSPTSATTTFQQNLGPSEIATGVFRITVTDNAALERSLSLGVTLQSL